MRIYGIGMIFLASIGMLTAGRQVWLQHLPPELHPSCGPDLNFLLENFPLTDALSYVFAGDGECAVVDWTLLGQSLAMWSLIIFAVLVIAGFIVASRRVR